MTSLKVVKKKRKKDPLFEKGTSFKYALQKGEKQGKGTLLLRRLTEGYW